MTNKVTIDNLKKRKQEIVEELEYKETPALNDELYEINDTLKKLGVNEKSALNFY
tara:strand:- start:405 stop:569 length:165 start_codon:yes stop_codon:yes gene_type:complete